jgi:hypothetical protein
MIKNTSLTVKQITPEMVRQYALSKNWKWFDKILERIEENNLKPLVVIANGFKGHLPYLHKDKKVITPDNVGRDNYIALATLFTRAAAMRYGEKIDYWQVENELNAAGLTVLWGWRKGKAWWDFDFLTNLLVSLVNAIKTEDPDSLVCVNFHTGPPKWKEDIKKWKKYLDIIGIDAYPNYILARPVYGEKVGDIVKTAKELTKKPIMVIETGYPSAPISRGYSEQNQAKYIKDAATSAKSAGAQGFFYFTIRSGEKPTTAGINPLFCYLGTIEGFWGLIRKDGSPKPAWFEYQKIIK